jgi:hypothetical protein
MKRFVPLLISSCVIHFAFAQEEIVLDSIQKNHTEMDAIQLNMERPLLLYNSFSMHRISLTDPSIFRQPLLPDYTKNLNFSKSLIFPLIPSESFSIHEFGPSPFYLNGVVYNQTNYRLNDRFSFGGNSFGAQSVFAQPRLNPSMQNMDTHGATIYLQYKVSKNLKVETRVNISNQQSPWEP